ncbi:MAG TPA: hypothetical protein DCW90_02285 [Lachnospiraceae bacterium]|mgnify:CR=1 FL=1|nr:hypothetical protein [Lachnospiraceae bacterium]
MAKLKLADVIATMTAEEKDGKIVTNRYNKKNFEKVLTAITSDPEFKFQVNKISKGELTSIEDISIGENFRNWCRKLVEAAGVDKNDSAVVMSEDFDVPSMNDWADFIAAAMLTYMDAGNEITLPSHGDIIPMTISVQKVPKTKKEKNARNPQTGEELGTFEYETAAHKAGKVKCKVPAYLKKKVKL